MINLTVKQFRDQEGWRKQLAESLAHNNGVVRTAVMVLKRHATIYTEPPVRPGLHPDAVAMHEYYRIMGWNQALAALEQMELPIPEASEQEKAANRMPWGDYVADDSELLKGAPPKPETYFQPQV